LIVNELFQQWHSCDCPVCKTDTVNDNGIHAIAHTNLSGAIPATQAAREMAHLIQKKAERGVVPAFLWKYLGPFIGHLPERFSHY
jgi:hypothetical protein